MKLSYLSFSAALMILALQSNPDVTAASDWPQLRGPNRNGTACHTADIHESSRLEIDWMRALGVGGYSSVVVADGRACTTFSDGKNDYAIALDAATGKERWRFRLDRAFPGRNGADTGPLSTPAIADGNVYALSPYGSFYAIRLSDGKQVWSLNIEDAFGGRRPEFGFTSSPLVADGTLFLQVGGRHKNTLVALDVASGEMRWSRYVDWVEYSSPALLSLDGVSQVVVRTNSHVFAVAPETGAMLWDRKLALGQQTHPTPFALSGNEVFVAGFDGSVLLRVKRRQGTKMAVEEVWKSRDLRGNFSEPVLFDGHIYGYSGVFLTCVDAQTGKKVWKSRQPGDGSLILINEHLLVLDSGGTLHLANATPEGYREQTSLRIFSGRSVTPPSFAQGSIFVRSLNGIARVSIAD
ncbi:PQQ-binding-like beta-propeller repeat protein [candidate division KSB1 bacterium]|nr:PQQ-binding-like beta-propeller repeat protein [candidate division KSB1 bacterium]NIR70452.1 PQQ-binding-like beta-propeller repeat protein [candidate division KSB1 bacterium]NIS23182.1 PQQ-binding-like beta-propeller repeat protein [candidate division KSB1 bacterium]NIT70042.1 PQQ-binding-like beta-propeller repeat protein [candidate division KSB1 bacterium]NIU23679.1 PQQ-binding-like beta-propeller repeat protein [candidate division KSB1 bacterium]